MKFYDCQTAPSPRRARIFIAEKGVEVETVEVDLGKGDRAQRIVDELHRSSRGLARVVPAGKGRNQHGVVECRMNVVSQCALHTPRLPRWEVDSQLASKSDEHEKTCNQRTNR